MAAIASNHRRHVLVVVEPGSSFEAGDWAGFRNDAITTGDVLSLSVVDGPKAVPMVPATSEAKFTPTTAPVKGGSSATSGVGYSVLNLVLHARNSIDTIEETVVHLFGGSTARSELEKALKSEKGITLRSHGSTPVLTHAATVSSTSPASTSSSSHSQTTLNTARKRRKKAAGIVSGVLAACLAVALGILFLPVAFNHNTDASGPTAQAVTSTPPSAVPTSTSTAPAPGTRPIQVNDCLSIRSGTLEDLNDVDLTTLVVPCDQPTSHIRIIGIEKPPDPNSTCASDSPCFWYGNSEVHYLFYALPAVGDCFVGWRVTPTSGGASPQTYDARASVLSLLDCEESPSWWQTDARKTSNAQSLGVDESQIEPARWIIASIPTNADDECTGDYWEWRVEFQPAITTRICASLKQ